MVTAFAVFFLLGMMGKGLFAAAVIFLCCAFFVGLVIKT